jgi:hypothetical protein
MYSVTDRSSFERANDYLKLIHRIFDATPATAPPIIVLANKLDLVANGSTWDTRVVTPEEVRTSFGPRDWNANHSSFFFVLLNARRARGWRTSGRPTRGV